MTQTKKPKLRCECPLTGNTPGYMKDWYSIAEKAGMYHAPNKCRCVNELKLYNRHGKTLRLCSCCDVPDDVEIPSLPKTAKRKKGEMKR
jgi:hypothetical protein